MKTREFAYAGSMTHEELREVVSLLLERLDVSVLRTQIFEHGDPRKESLSLINNGESFVMRED